MSLKRYCWNCGKYVWVYNVGHMLFCKNGKHHIKKSNEVIQEINVTMEKEIPKEETLIVMPHSTNDNDILDKEIKSAEPENPLPLEEQKEEKPDWLKGLFGN